MSADISAIVLAAGFSSRMQGFKPLLELGGQSALARCVGLFTAAGLGDVVVVTGHEREKVAAAAQELGARTAHNPAHASGMFGSVQAGVAALDKDCSGFFLLPVDIPLVRRKTVTCLLHAFATGGGEVLIPHFQGRPGHPPLIPGQMRQDLLAAKAPKGGLRSMLQNAQSRAVPVPDLGVLLDMDTDEDAARLQERAQRFGLPEREECEELLQWRQAPERVWRHGHAVATVALAMARALGAPLDMERIERAALVHDIAKGARQHEAEGARILAEWEFDAVANIVGEHRDLSLRDETPFGERELVFLADKLVQGERAVPLDQRYEAVLERHGHDPVAREAIEGRRNRARLLLSRLERELGRDIERLVAEALSAKA